MQISPSAALFQALSSISQPQGGQAVGTGAAQAPKAATPAAEAQTPQAVEATRTADRAEQPREPAAGERLQRGSLLDISA